MGQQASSLRADADAIIRTAIADAMPDTAVLRALSEIQLGNRVWLVAVGKAAWPMAAAAQRVLGERLMGGTVITKYEHSRGEIPRVEIYEAGHPVPDENSFRATERVLDLVRPLGEGDEVVFLLSGGGSALFEAPLVSGEELQDVTRQMLACGADIRQINTIRKRLSSVKGGRFARICAPAKVHAIILSDVLGDAVDAIASGPACPDPETAQGAKDIVERYHLRLSDRARALMDEETPKALDNVETRIIGSVRQLCRIAEATARSLGYRPLVLTADLCCTARDAGSFLASIVRTHADAQESLAFIAGGETVVRLTGSGLGGRNQELALAAAAGIDGLKDVCVFSVGSDGTDGPTDAAGGYADGETRQKLMQQGVRIEAVLEENDSYHALEACGGLIVTGATGTNVNDLSVALIKRG